MSLEKPVKEQSCVVRQNSNMYYEHRDSQATAMSVDWSGQWVLLAGRRHLALQGLSNEEDSCLRKYHRNSKYDVSAAEWSLCKNSQEYCAIATSQLIEVVTWSSGDPTLIYSLRAHTRMVTDIDWHSREPHLLASCSIDTFTHLWDLRDPRKPTLSLSAVCMSGATQVGFNRVSGHLLATAHDGDLRIWDIRKGSCPIQYITAHSSRIHGINWSHTQETCLTTASQDGTVKYFDVNNPKRAEKIITTTSPVWRARFTPVGNGLVTVVVPHLGRGENSLMLWSNNKQTEAICSFVGHTDVILDFAWRPNREDETSRELELITWSRDQTLRLWKIDDVLLQECEPSQTYDNLIDEITMKNSNSKVNLIDYHQQQQQQASVSSDNNDWPQKNIDYLPSCSLQHEFSLLNTNIPHIDVEILDSVKRFAEFKIIVSQYTVILQVSFPIDYPKPNIYPEFDLCEGTTLDDHIAISITKILKTIALQRVKRGKTCLEQCLRALVTSLKKSIGSGSSSSLRLQSPRLEGALTGALHDACVPFPRTSGVSFSIVGYLVHFSQIFSPKRISLRHQNITPRALSAISGGFLGNVMGTQPVLYAHRESNSSFYLQDRMGPKSLSKNSKKVQQSLLNIAVNIYNMQTYLNISKESAIQFNLDRFNVIETCRHNKIVSEQNGRPDLISIWGLPEKINNSCADIISDFDMMFYNDPFEKYILESLIMHFGEQGDIQTAAMLCCIFEDYDPYIETDFLNNYEENNYLLNLIEKSPTESPYHTILPMDPAKPFPSQHLAMQLKQIRSNSCSSDSFDYMTDSKSCSFKDIEPKTNALLCDSKMLIYDALKKCYGEILFAWGLLSEKPLILKRLSYFQNTTRQSIEFGVDASTCQHFTNSSIYGICRKCVFTCSLCRLPVRGLSNACLSCGHGGHTQHLDLWFTNHDYCAAGCGCLCLEETSILLKQIE